MEILLLGKAIFMVGLAVPPIAMKGLLGRKECEIIMLESSTP